MTQNWTKFLKPHNWIHTTRTQNWIQTTKNANQNSRAEHFFQNRLLHRSPIRCDTQIVFLRHPVAPATARIELSDAGTESLLLGLPRRGVKTKGWPGSWWVPDGLSITKLQNSLKILIYYSNKTHRIPRINSFSLQLWFCFR